MSVLSKKPVKYTLAAIGIIYIAVILVYAVYAAVDAGRDTGPSELAAHPEQAPEIMARDRALRMQEQLDLTDDQTAQVADVLEGLGPGGGPGDRPGPDSRDQRRTEMINALSNILTPEQLTQLEQEGPGMGMPGPGGRMGRGGGMGPGRGPGRIGGPGMGMDDEQAQRLMEKMTPEQKERFKRRLAERPQPPGNGPPPSGNP